MDLHTVTNEAVTILDEDDIVGSIASILSRSFGDENFRFNPDTIIDPGWLKKFIDHHSLLGADVSDDLKDVLGHTFLTRACRAIKQWEACHSPGQCAAALIAAPKSLNFRSAPSHTDTQCQGSTLVKDVDMFLGDRSVPMDLALFRLRGRYCIAELAVLVALRATDFASFQAIMGAYDSLRGRRYIDILDMVSTQEEAVSRWSFAYRIKNTLGYQYGVTPFYQRKPECRLAIVARCARMLPKQTVNSEILRLDGDHRSVI